MAEGYVQIYDGAIAPLTAHSLDYVGINWRSSTVFTPPLPLLFVLWAAGAHLLVSRLRDALGGRHGELEAASSQNWKRLGRNDGLRGHTRYGWRSERTGFPFPTSTVTRGSLGAMSESPVAPLPAARSVLGRVPPWAVAVSVVLVFGVLGWRSLSSMDSEDGFDGKAYVAYVSAMERTGRLPSQADTYEYALPPAFPLMALYGQQVADALPGARLVPGAPGTSRRILWLAVALAAVALAAAGGRARRVGIGVAVFAALWAGSDAVSFLASNEWSAGQLVTLAFGLGFLGLTWALAREVWPASRWAPALSVVACAALPPVLRQAGMFHPDGPFAFFAVLALLLLIRGRRLGWPMSQGLWVGAALGAAALTRQSAPVVIAALAGAALVDWRRRPWRFMMVAAGALILVVGPWWVYQTIRFGNPIQSFLERPELMLDRQPASFWLSFPLHDLITHPYRPAFTNELLPMFHAELWSDWFGIQHEAWRSPTPGERFFASTQSVLGLGWDMLALGGLLGFGAPALRRVVRGVVGRASDYAAAAGLLLAGTTWLAFVVTLVRFPQGDGDPIKANYMLFLAPIFAIAAVAAARKAWRRGVLWRVALALWAVAYGVSYAGAIATASALS